MYPKIFIKISKEFIIKNIIKKKEGKSEKKTKN